MVASLDGVIARSEKESSVSWNSIEDKKHYALFTKKLGCIILGSKTFDTFKKPFLNRTHIVLTSRSEEYKKKYKEYKNVYFLSANNPKEVLKFTFNLGFKKVVLSGGSTINTFFAKANLIDFIYLTIEPKIFGKGLHLFNENMNLRLRLLSTEKLNEDTLLVKYKVNK